MADFDFLDGFDSGGDWGFTGVASNSSDQIVSDTKATEAVVKQTSESVGKAVSGEIVNRLESKLDKIHSLINSTKNEIKENYSSAQYPNKEFIIIYFITSLNRDFFQQIITT